jgi:glycerol-1-phosphate dehydrogenase [NAD(P)+]
VDGFTSIGAPLVIGGTKRSYLCHGPAALFADLPTLCAAPAPMIAAGFGDLLGKLLSIADWKLGHLLWDEPFDQQIYDRSMQAALKCARHAAEIGQATGQAVRILMEGLIESGFCMLDFGNSNPASGAEHHLSHYWELKMLEEGRPATLHGTKVGVASLITAGWYQALRGLEKAEVERRLAEARLPDPQETVSSLHTHFGPAAGQIITEQRAFIYMDEAEQARLKERILDSWDGMLEIASAVPAPARLAEWLRLAGAPVTPRETGLGEGEVQSGIEYSHFLRKRFTIKKLRRWLGIPASL